MFNIANIHTVGKLCNDRNVNYDFVRVSTATFVEMNMIALLARS